MLVAERREMGSMREASRHLMNFYQPKRDWEEPKGGKERVDLIAPRNHRLDYRHFAAGGTLGLGDDRRKRESRERISNTKESR